MSFINFLETGYDHIAKGILYVICEIFWKIVHAVGNLVDVITGVFYKLTGANYLGSGGDTLIEEQDLLSQLFNQNIVTTDITKFYDENNELIYFNEQGASSLDTVSLSMVKEVFLKGTKDFEKDLYNIFHER